MPYAGIFFFVIPVTVAMLMYERVYRYYGAFSYTQEAIKVFKAILVSSLLTIAWAFLFRGGFSFRDFSYSRGVFLLNFFFALAFIKGHELCAFCLERSGHVQDVQGPCPKNCCIFS